MGFYLKIIITSQASKYLDNNKMYCQHGAGASGGEKSYGC